MTRPKSETAKTLEAWYHLLWATGLSHEATAAAIRKVNIEQEIPLSPGGVRRLLDRMHREKESTKII